MRRIKRLLSEETKSFIKNIIKFIKLPKYWLFCKIKGIGWDQSWTFHGLPDIRLSYKGQVILGKNVTIVSRSSKNSIGVNQPVIINAFGVNSVITIGNDTGISGSTITSISKIIIGSRVLIGSGCLIMDNDAHEINPGKRGTGIVSSKPIIIEDDVFIGARSIILKGVKIGEGAVIGAGSIVSCDVPAFAIAVGNPIRIIGDSRKK